MEIRQLRYFAGIVEMGSLSKAANVLSISQPSLSQQIAAMEYELGVPLLIRSSAGVRPTDAGKRLYHHARVVMRQVEHLRAEVSCEGEGATGEVAIGLPTSIAAVVAAPLIDRLRRDHPNVHVQVLESLSGYLLELLLHGRLDIAVLFRSVGTHGIAVRQIFVERLAVLGGPKIGASLNTCELAALDNVPMVLPSRTNGLRDLIERTFERANIRLNVIADVDSLTAMLAIAQDGEVATINSAVLSRILAPSTLARQLVHPHIDRPVSVCRPTAIPQSAAALAAEESLRTIFREMGACWVKSTPEKNAATCESGFEI